MEPGAASPLRNPGFLGLLGYRLLALLANQVLTVTVGWQVYQRTGDALSLGLIGLSEVIPYVGFALFAGYAVDHLPRRKVGSPASGSAPPPCCWPALPTASSRPDSAAPATAAATTR